MNWLAKINLALIIQRLGSFRSSILILVLLGISVYGGYRLGNYYNNYQKQKIADKDQQLSSLYQQQEKNLKQIHFLEVELEVEKLANQRSLETLKKMEQEHYQIKKALAFYEKVMAPEKQANGIVIDSFFISPTESKHHFRFQVTLVQQDKRKKYAKGFIDLTLSGSLNQQPKVLNIKTLAQLSKTALAFNFKYFQTIVGEFTLPEGFVPEQVNLSAIMPKGRWQKYNRIDATYLWSNLIEQE